MVYEQAQQPLDPRAFPLERVRLLARLSWSAALRNDDVFRETLTYLIEQNMDSRITREILLQLYLFCGFPTAIRAFEQLYHHAPEEWIASLPMQEDRTESILLWQERGQFLFEKIYGHVARRLFERMTYYHPDLARWMIIEGYGKVLMRPGVPVAVRELCIVAVLAVLDHPEQLRSHIRGALRVGAPASWVEAILKDCAEFTREDLHQQALNWLARYAKDATSS